MTNIEVIKTGLAEYLDKELMPLVPQNHGTKRFALSFIFSLLISKMNKIVEDMSSNWLIETSGIASGDEVDLDLIYNSAIEYFPEEGVTLPLPIIGDMIFKKEDVTCLYDTIKNKGVETNGNNEIKVPSNAGANK